MEKHRIYYTNYSDYDLKIQSDNRLLSNNDISGVVNVNISLFGKIEKKEYTDLEAGLMAENNKGISFKYLTFKDDTARRFLFVSEQNSQDRKIYVTRCLTRVNNSYNLYLNNYNDICAQGIGSIANQYFGNLHGEGFFQYLSILIYTITNLDGGNLEEEFNKNKKIV